MSERPGFPAALTQGDLVAGQQIKIHRRAERPHSPNDDCPTIAFLGDVGEGDDGQDCAMFLHKNLSRYTRKEIESCRVEPSDIEERCLADLGLAPYLHLGGFWTTYCYVTAATGARP
jgi:hypothetical protein